MADVIQHKHVLIRAEVNQAPGKNDIYYVDRWFQGLIKDLKMNCLSGPHIKYVDMPGNRGMTAVALIETSHIAMHVWDEVKPALIQLDVYTCGEMNLQTVFDRLNYFEPTKVDYKYFDRENGFSELRG